MLSGMEYVPLGLIAREPEPPLRCLGAPALFLLPCHCDTHHILLSLSHTHTLPLLTHTILLSLTQTAMVDTHHTVIVDLRSEIRRDRKRE